MNNMSSPRLGTTRALVGTTAIAIALSGCATASKDVATIYVSPMQYAPYDCEQLAAEAARIQSRVAALGGRLDSAATNDAALMGVGLILFWPALFFLGGTKEQEAEYARLKGEYEAVYQASIAKKCSPIPTAAQAAASAASAASAAGSAASQAASQ